MIKIISVAIKYDNKIWSLPPPNRHPDVIQMIYRTNGVGIAGPDIQGFITSEAEFVNRVDALKIALAAGQVLDVNDIRAGRLFSEDLWK